MIASCLRKGWIGACHFAARSANSPKVDRKVKDSVTVMNEQIKTAIRTRASQARSNEEVVAAIFNTLRDYRIDVRHVSLEDMKSAVVEATRAARADGNENNSLPV